MRTLLHGSDKLPADDFHDAFRPGRLLRECVEVLLKGPELPLPDGASFVDKDGHVRTAIRTRWWAPELTTFDRAYIGPAGASIPALKLPAGAAVPEPDRPTFIGHYWLDSSPTPALLSEKVACVDYSVAKGGPMTAYRFQGEATLTPKNFVAV